MSHDRQLVSSFLLRNDQEAFTRLHERHQSALLRVTRRLMQGSQTDAEDLAQDVWLRAIRSLSRFEWRSGFRTWLIGIAMNRARDLLRHRMEQPARLEERMLISAKAGGPTAERICETIDLARTLRILTPHRRKVLLMSDVGGFTHREIAAHLRITATTSKSQLCRARKAIRDHLAPAA